MSHRGKLPDSEDSPGAPDARASDERPEGQDPGVTYGSNVSGSQVHSFAVGDQARAITVIHQGLSFTETERLFGLLFEQNFPKLAEQARAEARRRVDEFAATFARVATAQHVTKEQLAAFAEPDVQFVLNEAIQAAARKDDAELRQCLSTLVLRQLEAEHDRDRVILAEAASAMAKLTSNQMKILALCILTWHPKLLPEPQDIATFNQMLDAVYLPFVSEDARTEVDVRHLEYTGCCSLAPMGQNAAQMWSRWEALYPSIFQKPFDDEDVEALGPAARSIVRELAVASGSGAGHVIAGGRDAIHRTVLSSPIEEKLSLLDQVNNFHHAFSRELADLLLKESPTGARIFELSSSSWLPSIGMTPVGMAVAAAVVEAVTGQRLHFDVTRPPQAWRPPS